MANLRRLFFVFTLLLVTSLFAADKVNINTASAQQLAAGLKGVGMDKAAAIVKYREQHGSFVKVEDLAKVKGIGAQIIARNREVLATK